MDTSMSGSDLAFSVYTPWNDVCGLGWKVTSVSDTKIKVSCSTYRIGYFEKGSEGKKCSVVKPTTDHPVSEAQ